MIEPQERFMQAAIEEATKAKEKGDYAIGAVIVKDGEILARSPNRAIVENDPTQHAEMAAIREAARVLHDRHLTDCILYTTHEPCPMCATACVWAQLKGVVIGARVADMEEHRARHGNETWSWKTLLIPAREIFAQGNPPANIVEDFMRDNCKKLFHS